MEIHAWPVPRAVPKTRKKVGEGRHSSQRCELIGQNIANACLTPPEIDRGFTLPMLAVPLAAFRCSVISRVATLAWKGEAG